MPDRHVLALIPARGGSKSIPRKNLLPINGRPLIAYSIAQARASARITRVVVSTDDEEIAEVARASGAEVPFMRPPQLAHDQSTDFDVFDHALRWLRDQERYECACVAHLRPTGPVRRVALIDEAIDTLLGRPDADSLRSVSRPEQTPYKMWRMADGLLEPLLADAPVPEAHSAPRQLLPAVFWQNGYIDVVRPRTILELRSMAGRRIVPFIVREPIFELDYPESIGRVEEALRRLEANEPLHADTVDERHSV